MRYAITVAILFSGVLAFGQVDTSLRVPGVYQVMPQAGYGPVKRMQIDSVFTIPEGITATRNLVYGRNRGQLRYNPADSGLYVWTGTQFLKSNASGGAIDSTVYVNGFVVNDSTLRFYRLNGDSSDFVIKGADHDLQKVTDRGNTTTNSIVLGDAMLKLNPDGRVGSNQLDVYSGPDYSAPTGINSIVSSATGFWTNNLPNADGILAVAVNGNFAGTDGNIVVPVGGTTIDETIVATGGQTAFTFTSVPADYANYLIFINGAEIENATYFTTSGNIVTFTSGLVAGDRVRYRRIK